MDKKHTWNLGYWAIAVMLLLLLQDIWQSATQVQTVSYSEFEKALREGRVADITVSDRTVIGRLTPSTETRPCWLRRGWSPTWRLCWINLMCLTPGSLTTRS